MITLIVILLIFMLLDIPAVRGLILLVIALLLFHIANQLPPIP